MLELARRDLGIGLVSADAEAAARYYADILGFRRGETREDAAGTRCVTLHAGRNRMDLLQPAIPPPRHDGAIYAATGIRVLAVFCDDLDATIAAIHATGRRVAPARDLPGSLRITFAKDADGNMLELIGLPEPAPGLSSRLQIGLTVRSVTAARRFYGETLGLPEQPPQPMPRGLTRHAFSAGRTTLKLWVAPEPAPRGGGRPGDAIGLRFLRAEVADLDAAVSLTGRPASAPSKEAVGSDATARVAEISDPDGNRLRLVEAP